MVRKNHVNIHGFSIYTYIQFYLHIPNAELLYFFFENIYDVKLIVPHVVLQGAELLVPYWIIAYGTINSAMIYNVRNY